MGVSTLRAAQFFSVGKRFALLSTLVAAHGSTEDLKEEGAADDEDGGAVLAALEDASRLRPRLERGEGIARAARDAEPTQDSPTREAAGATDGDDDLPPPLDAPSGSCFQRHWPVLQLELAPTTSELPLIPRQLYDAQGRPAPGRAADAHLACVRHGHSIAILELQLLDYFQPRDDLPRFKQYLLHKFQDHVERYVRSEVVEMIASGVAICAPRQCSGDPEQMAQGVAAYIAYALGLGKQAAWLPPPRLVLDMSISALLRGTEVSSVSGCPSRDCEDRALKGVGQIPPTSVDALLINGPAEARHYDEPFESGCIVGRVPEAAQLCWRAELGLALPEVGRHEFDDRTAQSQTSDNFGPSWLACDTPGQFDPSWRLLRRLLQQLHADDASVSEQRDCERRLLTLADELIRRHAWSAWDWVEASTIQSVQLCGSRHLAMLHHFGGDEFCVYHYLLGGPADLWGFRRCRARWSSFCPSGFAAALLIRARVLRAEGHVVYAEDDLRMASALLGWCSEFDFLDPSIWHVRSSDIHRELLVLQAPSELVRAVLDSQEAGVRSAVTSRRSPTLDHLTDIQSRIWHALQLNALVRFRISRVAAAVPPREKPPALALLTFPAYLALLLVPALQQVWPALRLSIFYLGVWQRHEKCPECMAEYRQRYVVEAPSLQGLPLDFTKQIAGDVAWSASLSDKEFLAILKEVFGHHPRASAAEVFLCTAPLWLCAMLLLVAARPVMSLCLMDHGLGAPPGFGAAEARQTLFERVVEPLAAAMRTAPPAMPRNLWVREDMARSYTNMELQEYGFFHPFVSLLSTYITARYLCRETSDAVVMREGSLGRFAPTIRGQLFFSALAQSAPTCSWRPACPWGFKVLPYSKERLPYTSIAAFRAAIFMPLVWYGKMTFKDILTMEIPLFMPDVQLQTSISSVDDTWGCGHFESKPRWAFALCQRLRIAHRLEQSSFFRYPYVQHFASLGDLVHRLGALDCQALRQLSAQMRRWNAALMDDDLEFWRTALIALARTRADDVQVLSKASRYVSGSSADAAAVRFQLPVSPASDEETVCGGLAQHCLLLDDSEERLRCCTEVALATSAPFAGADLLRRSGVSGDRRGCLRNPTACPEELIRYGVHLAQRLPERIAPVST